MTTEDRLAELLCRWDEACEQGREPPIDDLCRDCPDLAAPFRKLLAGMAQIDGALESTETPEVTAGPASASNPRTMLPMTLGRYRVTRVLGHGGLGDVFGAEDSELAREVAVKRIRGTAAMIAERRRRFAYEAQITSALDHPGVVPVYGYGEDDQGTPYYAMRLVRGRSLDDLILEFHAAEPNGTGPAAGSTRPARDPGERNIEFRKLLRGFIGLCETIAYAHSRGILHRDIKPQNVMIGAYGETLVVDWGLAKQMSDSPLAEKIGDAPTTIRPLPHGATSQTRGTIGTPEYMSPEQWFGEGATPAGDIFSLGATLWKLLVGKSRLADKRRSEIERLVAVGHCPSPETVKTDVPPALAAICVKSMSVDPADRYATADALAADVELWLAGEPVSVYQEPLSQRAVRWSVRNVPYLAAALLAVVTLTLLGLLVAAQNQGATQEQQIESLQKQNRELRSALDAKAPASTPHAPGAARTP